MLERRAFKRSKRTYPVTLKTKGTSVSFPCQTVNISRTGIAVKTKERLLIPSDISLDITPTSKYPPITTEAQLIWNSSFSSDGSSCYGLRFTDLEEDSSLTLRRLLGYEVDHIVTASYLPEQVVTNKDIVKMGFKGPAIVLERGLGAKERRAVAPDETATDMYVKVAKEILNKAGLLPEQLDRILCSSEPQDAGAPDTSTRVQGLLKATCPAYGFSMSCTGWHAAIDTALRCLKTGENHILVLASSCVGSWLHFHNPMHRAIFGDGAGGILLEKQHLKKFLSIGLWTLGQYYSKIYVPYPWSKPPKDIPSEYEDSFYMTDDQKMFFNVMDHSSFLPFAESILSKAKVKKKDIDLFLLHYASKPLYEHFLKSFGVPREKTFNKFKSYGNVIAAEMPILLDEVISTGRIKEGDLVFVYTYGAGFTAGGFVMQY
jgi:3-oxoacyl-[acyl-carrier-protein] synthase-3